ncbi:MAG: hypothetical protein A4E19_13650 [Nitrospira sp. SG-bin1]|nr:MAG: hypothetical protein A4E19_13650 [Nitrospira sp. SG-bin1]
MVTQLTENERYHLGELRIAKDTSDPRRIMPMLPDQWSRILDIGCGAGQTLLGLGLPLPGKMACGGDIDLSALRLGHQLSPQTAFMCARGEQLPFVSASFELVISRVAMPYMHVPSVLKEIERILVPGGTVWLALHPITLAWKWLWTDICSLNLKRLVYRTYVLANGMGFHLTGRLCRYPLHPARCESFQTVRGMTKALNRVGLQLSHHCQSDTEFVLTARKTG